MLQKYTTITSPFESTYKEKGSVFIGKAYPVQSAEECLALLEKKRKEYYDAVHHCCAYRLSDGSFKYSDDGEPSGTAGIRLFNAIEHDDVYNVLVVVIRYFGGVKLGVGPLGKAYYTAAHDAVQGSVKIEKNAYVEITVASSYEQSSPLYHTFAQFPVKILDTVFNENTKFILLVRFDVLEDFKKKLIEVCNGKVTISKDSTDIIYQ